MGTFQVFLLCLLSFLGGSLFWAAMTLALLKLVEGTVGEKSK